MSNGFAWSTARLPSPAKTTIEEAQATGHASSLCYALADAACLIALWNGDLEAADRYTTLLVDRSTRLVLPAWQPVGHRYRSVFLVRRGDNANGLPQLRAGFQIDGRPLHAWTRAMFLGELAQGLARAALSMPLCGELVPRRAAAGANEYFRRSLDCVQRQGALSWESRAATSLARLPRDQGRPADAIACPRPVYDRFTEGFDSVDLIAAKQLPDHLSRYSTSLRPSPGLDSPPAIKPALSRRQ